MNKTILRIGTFVIISIFVIGCSSPFINVELQSTQRTHSAAQRNPTTSDSELQGSSRSRTSEATVDATLDNDTGL